MGRSGPLLPPLDPHMSYVVNSEIFIVNLIPGNLKRSSQQMRYWYMYMYSAYSRAAMIQALLNRKYHTYVKRREELIGINSSQRAREEFVPILRGFHTHV